MPRPERETDRPEARHDALSPAARLWGGSPFHDEDEFMTRYFGAHTIDTGGIHMAVRRAAGARATALQVFTAIPKYYGDKSSIRPERVERFRAALAASGIAPAHVLVHAAY